jgi:hypothetical protein
MSRPADAIPDAGHSRFDAGVNMTWAGSMNRQMTKQQRKSHYFKRSPEEAPTGDVCPRIHRPEIVRIKKR